MRIAFVVENINMGRLFDLLEAELSEVGVGVLYLCSNATGDAVAARNWCVDNNKNIVDIPRRESLDVFLPRLFYRVPLARYAWRDVVGELGIDCLVVGNDQALISGQLVESAKGAKVPVVLIQDGLRPRSRAGRGVSLKSRFHLCLRQKLCYWSAQFPGYGGRGVDGIAASGEVLKSDLEKMGANLHIQITGTPTYEYLHNHIADSVSLVYEKEPCGLFVQQDLEAVHPELLREFMRSCIQSICLSGKTKLFFKLHPRSRFSEDDIRELVPEVGDLLVVPSKKQPISDFLSQVHFVVTAYSTVAVEAIYRGIPVLFADWLETPLYLVGEEEGEEMGWISSPEKLTQMVVQVLDDQDFRDQLWKRQFELAQEHVRLPDGQSVERIVELILNVGRPE